MFLDDQSLNCAKFQEDCVTLNVDDYNGESVNQHMGNTLDESLFSQESNFFFVDYFGLTPLGYGYFAQHTSIESHFVASPSYYRFNLEEVEEVLNMLTAENIGEYVVDHYLKEDGTYAHNVVAYATDDDPNLMYMQTMLLSLNRNFRYLDDYLVCTPGRLHTPEYCIGEALAGGDAVESLIPLLENRRLVESNANITVGRRLMSNQDVAIRREELKDVGVLPDAAVCSEDFYGVPSEDQIHNRVSNLASKPGCQHDGHSCVDGCMQSVPGDSFSYDPASAFYRSKNGHKDVKHPDSSWDTQLQLNSWTNNIQFSQASFASE